MNKSEKELELDQARKAYKEHFGEPYVFQIGGPYMTMEETTGEIYRLIEAGKKQRLMRYRTDVDY